MKRKIICLTPVKNEAWILNVFLNAASLWADHIIISDQGSTDNSREIAQSFGKVTLIDNAGTSYNESERQKQLLEEARKIHGENNIFMALDADEILVNYQENPEWEQLQNETPGTTILLPWLNVLPGCETYYGANGGEMLFGYIDDGRPHKGTTIHSNRVPSDLTENRVKYKDLKILHFQYALKERLLSKHRWYECFEKIKFPHRNNIDIYRQYHHIDLPISGTQKIEPKWLVDLKNHNISLHDIKDNGEYWWDKEVCLWFDKYGVDYFRKQAIWYIDWKKVYQLHIGNNSSHIIDPRTKFDKLVHQWLAKSQTNRFGFWNKVINKLLRIINW